MADWLTELKGDPLSWVLEQDPNDAEALAQLAELQRDQDRLDLQRIEPELANIRIDERGGLGKAAIDQDQPVAGFDQ